jgi:hypothetical protein
MSSDNTYSMPPFKTILKQVVIRSRDLRKKISHNKNTGATTEVKTRGFHVTYRHLPLEIPRGQEQQTRSNFIKENTTIPQN